MPIAYYYNYIIIVPVKYTAKKTYCFHGSLVRHVSVGFVFPVPQVQLHK
jgi:hypothetical protein